MDEKTKFLQWLQTEMDKRSWSQSDLARAANLHRAVISKLVRGLDQPQHTTLRAISRALDIPIETTYRAAGLLSPDPDSDEFVEEAIYLLRKIQDARRRAIAVQILRVLADEEASTDR